MNKRGVLFLVVGPSGVGKDSILIGARSRLSAERKYIFARRTITRAVGSGGEEFDAVSVEEFQRRQRAGEFLAWWRAHKLYYGLPNDLLRCLQGGQHVFANVSRASLTAIASVWPRCCIVDIWASPGTLVRRLHARRRETADDIAARLARTAPPYPADIELIRIENNGSLDEAINRFLTAIDAHVHPHQPGADIAL